MRTDIEKLLKKHKEENKQLKDENHRLLTIIEKLSNGK